MSMFRFFVQRLLSAITVLMIVIVIVFMLIRLTGDPAAIVAGESATTEQIQKIREGMGLTPSAGAVRHLVRRFAARGSRRIVLFP